MRRTISQFAKAAGVPVSTVRYYERIGLVVPSDRTEKGYRIYDQNDLDRVRYIRSALAAGFNLGDLPVLTSDDCGRVLRTMETRLTEIDARSIELGAKRKALKSLLQLCASRDGENCPVPEAIRSSDF